MSTKAKTDVIEMMGEWYEKVPALPKRWQEKIVKIIPILSLIFGILGIILAIGGLGAFTLTAPVAFLGGAEGVASYGNGFLMTLIYLVGWALMLAAYPGLKAKKGNGWNLLFWSEVVFLIGGLISISGIFSAIIGALIAFYFLYQIRSYYK